MYKEEISEFLLGEMSDTFNCELEDGSDQEVAFLHAISIVDRGDHPPLLQGVPRRRYERGEQLHPAESE